MICSQSVERETLNLKVAGSTPALGFNAYHISDTKWSDFFFPFFWTYIDICGVILLNFQILSINARLAYVLNTGRLIE